MADPGAVRWPYRLGRNDDGLPLRRTQAEYAAVRAFGWITPPITRRLRDTTGGQRLELAERAA